MHAAAARHGGLIARRVPIRFGGISQATFDDDDVCGMATLPRAFAWLQRPEARPVVAWGEEQLAMQDPAADRIIMSVADVLNSSPPPLLPPEALLSTMWAHAAQPAYSVAALTDCVRRAAATSLAQLAKHLAAAQWVGAGGITAPPPAAPPAAAHGITSLQPRRRAPRVHPAGMAMPAVAALQQQPPRRTTVAGSGAAAASASAAAADVDSAPSSLLELINSPDHADDDSDAAAAASAPAVAKLSRSTSCCRH